MSLFDHFPYTNFHELNLDWILKALRELDNTIDQFVALNSLKYADPIQWDITSQYEKNTIVIDPQTGTAYISVAPVPVGTALTNTDFWAVVFDLSSFITRAAQNLANVYEAETTTSATVSIAKNSWIVWGDVLYKALTNITAGDTYVIGGNIAHFTIEDVCGHLEDLRTANKNNLVAAINELVGNIVAEISNRTNADTTLQNNITAEATARGNADTTLQNNITAEATARGNADTAINNKIGNMSNLQTPVTADLVRAINSIYDIAYDFVIIGDSYSADQYTLDQNIKPWWQYVAEQKHLTPHNYATSMMGFIATATYPTSFRVQIASAEADTSFNNDNVRLVAIQGSINDFTHETANPSDIFTEADATIKAAKTAFPNAEIVLFMGNTFGSYPAPNTVGGVTYKYYEYINQINHAAAVNGVWCICDQYYWIFDQFMFLNGYGGHPGAYGQRSMASFFLSGGLMSARTKPIAFADMPTLYIRRMGYNQYMLQGSASGGATWPMTLPNQLDFEYGATAAVVGAISGTQAAVVTLINTTLNNPNNVPFGVKMHFNTTSMS